MSSSMVRRSYNCAVAAPILGTVLLALTWTSHPEGLLLLPIAAFLIGAVLAAVHHAEVIAHKVGEPFGSLILAVAVTVIEVGLIVMLMTSGDDGASTYAHDPVFVAVMITLDGIAGLALLGGALKFHLVSFNASGTGSALATVILLAGVTPGPAGLHRVGGRPGVQPLPAGLRGTRVPGALRVVRRDADGRHRDSFLPVASDERGRVTGLLDIDEDGHADPPTRRPSDPPTTTETLQSLGLLVVALLVLARESISAARNAARDRVQTSLNLAYGSAMASIGPTIPTIAVAMIWLEGPRPRPRPRADADRPALAVRGGRPAHRGAGRVYALQGILHLVLLAAFLFLSIQP